MQGLISSVDSISKDGRIQGDDGHIYSFDKTSFSKAEDADSVCVGIRSEFEADDRGFCTQLELLDVKAFAEDSMTYFEPPATQIDKGMQIVGYEIIDRAGGPIVKGDRNIEHARYRLLHECESLGANAVLNYSIQKQVRNSFGFGFAYYNAYGIPAVIGRPDVKGDCTRRELASKLNHKKINSLRSMVENATVAKIVLRILGGILLVIFTVGFIMRNM